MFRLKNAGNLLALTLLLGVIFLVACSPGLEKQGTLAGEIVIVGNEPFTSVALKNEEGKIFVLQCNSDTEKYLRSKQGSSFIIEYDGKVNTPNGEAVVVKNAQPSEK